MPPPHPDASTEIFKRDAEVDSRRSELVTSMRAERQRQAARWGVPGPCSPPYRYRRWIDEELEEDETGEHHEEVHAQRLRVLLDVYQQRCQDEGKPMKVDLGRLIYRT